MNFRKAFLILLGGILPISALISQTKNISCKPLIRHQAILGEGSIWDWRTGLLYWIDIDRGCLYSYEPIQGKEEKYDLGQKVGTIVPVDTGGVVVALKDGIYVYNPRINQFHLLASPEKELTANRYNDGKCDPEGRFWVGSTGPQFQAALYRISADGSCSRMLDSVSTSNGLVWTRDKKIMYYIDTNTGCVRAFDFDAHTGNISHPRVVIRFPQGVGYPDGMTIDENDMLWIAHWGGYCVGEWNPVTGKMITRVDVPAPFVTSCSFGGKDLKTLYITTASTGMSQDDLSKYPESGNVFVAWPGVKGVKAFYFKSTVDK